MSDLEQILSGPIVQHNIDKYQRQLLKYERELERKRDWNGELKGKKEIPLKKIPPKDLPELEHAFLEGIQMSISDLAAFLPVERVMEKIGEKDFNEKFPTVRKWFYRCARIFLSKASKLDNSISEIILDYDPVLRNEPKATDDFVVIARRQTPLKEISPALEKDDIKSDIHSKSSKSMIQKLELSAKVDLETVRSKLPTPDPYSHVAIPDRDEIVLDGFADPGKGGLGKERTERKLLQLQNMVARLRKMDTKGKIIVDFCAGGGHLGLAAAKVCPEATVVLVETKEESLNRARSRIQEWNVKNVVICQSNLTKLNCKFDIGLAVHACGSATDQVIQMCLKWRAAFIVSPCCYGRVSDLVLPRSKEYQKRISSQESLLLAHAADITPLDESLTKTGKGKT